jgi:hypothetical protein
VLEKEKRRQTTRRIRLMRLAACAERVSRVSSATRAHEDENAMSLIGSGGFVLFVAAQDVPVDIRSQVLASDGAVCDLLNLNTALYRNPANTVDPL